MPAGPREERSRYRVGRYVVTGRIGRGGMGMVYRALDETLEREVAVKILHVEGSLDAESRRRFEVEAKAAAKLQHPNIVTVFELGEDRGVPFIAMELLPGVDLEALLRSGEGLLLAEKLDIVIQLCRGLAFAHDHGIVHRDIKPSNIRLLDDGTAKIMDFGIAKLGGTTLTKTGMMVGTIFYMSPEQVRGRGLDGRSDVFSAGVILYELLAGQRPFRGEGPTDILYKIAHEPPEPLDTAALQLDPRLADVVTRSLEKDPERRFPTADALAEALQPMLDAARGEAREGLAPEPLSAARRLLKEGRVDESLTALRSLAATSPRSIEVRRALRAAVREQDRRHQAVEGSVEEYPELEATYRASPTSRGVDTVVPLPTMALDIPATKVLPEPAAHPLPPSRSPQGMLLLGAGGLALVGLALGVVFLRGRAERADAAGHAPGGPSAAVSPSPVGHTSSPEPSAPAASGGMPSSRPDPTRPAAPSSAAGAIVPVITDPPGAAVSLDGQKVPGTTPLDLSLDPHTSHRVRVSLEGYAAHDLALEPGKTQVLRLRLEPAGPPAGIFVSSTYPIEVSWRGRTLAKAEVSPRVQVPGGRQVLTIVAPAHFLSTDLTVDAVPGSEVTVNAPALGRVSVRANPDNSQVFIDGTFVDYPPILDKPVAAGKHVVTFKWPDGVELKEAVEVSAGKVTFVTGRKR
jgi:Protein kinase domain/PEGA domain